MEPLWLLGASLAPLWASFGAPWGHFLGSLEVLLAAVGCFRAPLGLPGGSWVVLGASRGRLVEFGRVFRVAFWTHFRLISVVFSFFFRASFFD